MEQTDKLGMEQFILLISLLWPTGSSAVSVEKIKEKHVSIRVGATLKEALIAYGKPFSANEETDYTDSSKYLQLIYMGDVCAGSSCSVIIKGGLVARLHNVKPELSGFSL